MVAVPSGVFRQTRNQRILCKELMVNGQIVFPKLDTGNFIFVDSVNGSAGATGEGPDAALSTLDAAFAKCTANQGDIIVVMPNHAETITGAAGIAHDVAGVSVIGLGHGNQRPRFLMDGGTSVTYAITADDAYVANLVFAAGHADIVACITTTKKYTFLENLEFVDNTTDENFLTEIKATSTTDNDSDGLTVIGCRAITPDTAGVEFIEINADIDNPTFENNLVIKDAATAAKFIFVATGKDLRGLKCSGNRMAVGSTSGDLLIDNDTTVNTGVVFDNIVGHHVPNSAAVILVDCDGVREFNNRSVPADGDTYWAENPVFGRLVTKVGTLASAPDALFDIVGKVMITSIVGEVTSAVATTTSLQLETSTSSVIIATSTQITTDAAGTLYYVTGDPDDALNGGQTPNVEIANSKTGFRPPMLMNDDSIMQVINGAGTGLIQWDLHYVPLEAGAYVIAAA